MTFDTTQLDIDAIKVAAGINNVIIKGNIFKNIKGGAVRSVSGQCDNIQVLDNTFLTSGNTVMYFGTHEGTFGTTNIRVERNLIVNVTAPDPAVGYAIQVCLFPVFKTLTPAD